MAEVRFVGAIRKAAGMATFGIDAATVEELLERMRRETSAASLIVPSARLENTSCDQEAPHALHRFEGDLQEAIGPGGTIEPRLG
jgi:hypothetical protein